MTAVAALALLAAAPHTEQRIPLKDPGVAQGTAVYRLPPIDNAGAKFVRLALGAEARAALNGSALVARPDGLFDLPYLARENTVTVSPPVAAELRVTTRVFVESAEVTVTDGRMRALVSVRNTLENTSNVYVTVTLGTAVAQASGTVPPGGASQNIAVEGASGTSATEARITIEKEPEAMEGGYVFETSVPVRRR